MQRSTRPAPLLLAALLAASCGWYESSPVVTDPNGAEPELESGDSADPGSAVATSALSSSSAVPGARTTPRARLEAIEIFDRADARPGHFVDGAVVAYLEVDSLEELESVMRRLADAGLPGMPTVASPIALRGDRKHVDAGRPIGVALTLPWDHTRPLVTTIVPVTDRTAFLASVPATPNLHAIAAGGYVALSDDPEVALRDVPHPITQDMPKGSMRARADLAPLVERFGPLAEAGLAQLLEMAETGAEAEVPPEQLALVREQVETARALMRCAERLDTSLTLSGSELVLDASIVMRAESELAAVGGPATEGLRDLALCIDPADAVVVLGAMDAPVVRAWMDGWIERLEHSVPSLPGVESLEDLFPSDFAKAFSASGEIGLGGSRFTSYYRPSEPAAFVQRLHEQLAAVDVEALGIQRIGPRQRTIGKIPVTEFLFARRLGDGSLFSRNLLGFFEDGLRMRVALHEGVVALVTGGDDGYLVHSIVRLGKEKTRLAEGLDTALEHVGSANPCFVVRLDLARLTAVMIELASMRSDSPGAALPHREPVPLTVYGGVEGSVWRVGLAFDYAAYAALMRARGGAVAQSGF